MWIPFVIIGSIILFLLLVSLSGLYCMYRFTFYSPLKGQNDDFKMPGPQYIGFEQQVQDLVHNMVNIPYEDAYIKSFDNLQLHAYVYPNPYSKRVAIMCHGYRGTPRRDFSGGGAQMIELGVNVILIDERAHGLSEGHSITFGLKEKNDVLSWVDYAKKRFGEDVEIILVGISMGAATILFCADKIENAKIIADCPFAKASDLLKRTMVGMKLNPKIFFPILNLSSILFGHANMNKDNAYETIKNNKNNKILIIHGDNDTLIPHQMTMDLYEKNKDKIQYELFPRATHGMSFLYDTPRYKKVVEEFVNK